MMTEDAQARHAGEWRIPATARRLAVAWLVLGVAALAVAGLFAILLVLARTPGLEPLFPTADFFRTALVVHVDQSVLIWFLAFGGILWSLGACTPRPPSPARWLAFGLAALGALLVAAAPFLGAGDPLLNNYVPVLRHDLFYVGLGSFGAGAFLQAVLALRTGCDAPSLLARPLDLATLTAAVAAIAAGAAFAWTWLRLAGWQGQAYFEFLFWGSGHVLQFAYAQLMLAAWLALASALGLRLRASPRVLGAVVLLGILPLLFVPAIYVLHGVDTAEARSAFTTLMQWGGGLAPVPIGLLVALGLLRRRGYGLAGGRPLRNALAASLLLFAAGGAVGMAISGVNTVIPAHYHGSIVGVTLALMGLTYHLLPQLGYAAPPPRLAAWQPWVYAIGQLLHVGGLAVSGAMGIQRKTAGAAQGLDTLGAKAAMGVMGLGGLLAVIGGILFVVAVIAAMRRRAAPAAQNASPPR
jgi:heme/copper-type cytochrome/quinol oxidase subunit 1